MRFLIDNNCHYLAHMLREYGYEAESVKEIRHRLYKSKTKLKARHLMFVDSHVLEWAMNNDMILITSDWQLYRNAKEHKHPVIRLYYARNMISKREHLMNIIAHFDPNYFRNWLVSGMWSMAKELKYEGDWDRIKPETKYSQRKINEVYNYDALGYQIDFRKITILLKCACCGIALSDAMNQDCALPVHKFREKSSHN